MSANSSRHQQIQTNYIGAIPVRNVWLLMLYASDLFRYSGRTKISVEDNPDQIPDLVAEVLVHFVERRLKKNLYYGYQTRTDNLHRVRGRIDIFNTERHRLLEQGKVACRFEELTINRPRNCYVRAALETLSMMVGKPVIRQKCRYFARAFKQLGVTGAKPTRQQMSVDRLGRHDSEDRQMIAAADLAFNLAMPTQLSGFKDLLQPGQDITWLRLLYEKAVAGFYRVVLTPKGWKADAGKIYNWQMDRKTEGITEVMPVMKTDIVLEHAASCRRIIIDTKFNAIYAHGRYRDQTLRSTYIYQIYSYLRSQEQTTDPLSINSSGLLLHPAINKMICESVVIQGHEIKFATVDLGAEARVIRQQLLNVLGSFDEGCS